MDDKNQRRPQDSSRINVNEPYELRYWSEKFGISADELREAVRKFGTGVEKVRENLKK